MKKAFIIMLIALLLATTIAEAQQKPSTSGITVNRRVQPGTQPAAGAQPGTRTTTQYFYVADKDVTLPDKTKVSTGDTISSASEIKLDGLRKIPTSTYQYTTKNNQYTYSNGVFTFSREKVTPDENLFEKYRTKTTTTIVVNPDGSVTRTVEEETYICGAGLTKCTTWSPVPGSHQSITTEFAAVTKTDEVTKRETTQYFISAQSKPIYDKSGEQVATLRTAYRQTDPDDKFSAREPSLVSVSGPPGDTTVYYLAAVDPNTGTTTVEYNKIDQIPGLTGEQKDQVRVEIVESGVLGFGGAWETLTFWQSLGRFVRAFNEYQGLRQLSGLFWPGYAEDVQKRRQELEAEFCGFAGITNCITSVICGSIYEIEADNILTGRGPTGQYVSSASLNAERSLPIDIQGLTRQQLIDLFGNTTVIAGRLVNLTDPTFDPKVLGRMKLRLYHVQYSVRNNAAGEEDLQYNIVFGRVPQEINSSYGIPIQQAKWYPQDKTIAYLEDARENLYKFSGTEYNSVCLTFDPDLPSGHAAMSDLVDKLCVPFVEYQGGPTEMGGEVIPEEPVTGPPSQSPGGLI